MSQCEAYLNPHILLTLQNLPKYFKVPFISLLHKKKLQKCLRLYKSDQLHRHFTCKQSKVQLKIFWHQPILLKEFNIKSEFFICYSYFSRKLRPKIEEVVYKLELKVY